jgi:hypothetical protein
MALVDHTQGFDRAVTSVVGIVLIGVQPRDVKPGDVDFGLAVHDPMRHGAAQTRTHDDADGIQPGSDEVVFHLGRFAHNRREVGGKAFRTAEKGFDAQVLDHRHARDGLFHKGPHAVPVRFDFAEGEVFWNPLDIPWRAYRLKQPDHEPADLFTIIAVVRRVFQHGHIGRHAFHLFGDQIVMLGGLIGNIDTGHLAQLACPHAGTIDDDLGLDIP